MGLALAGLVDGELTVKQEGIIELALEPLTSALRNNALAHCGLVVAVRPVPTISSAWGAWRIMKLT